LTLRRFAARVEAEVMPMSAGSRRQALQALRLVHPRPEAVTAPLFGTHPAFFLASDKVQVKYEMLRAHAVDGRTASAAAADHGYSRAAFYLIADAFAERGMLGLLDERPGRRGPLKLTNEVAAFLTAADPSLSGAVLAELVRERFGVTLHRRTIERARRR
jgi:transposase